MPKDVAADSRHDAICKLLTTNTTPVWDGAELQVPTLPLNHALAAECRRAVTTGLVTPGLEAIEEVLASEQKGLDALLEKSWLHTNSKAPSTQPTVDYAQTVGHAPSGQIRRSTTGSLRSEVMALVPRLGATCLIALVLAVAEAVACSKRKSNPAGIAAARVLGRYWLTNTELQSERAGEKGFTVTAPTLVELLSNGRVRSIPTAKPRFEGLLPPLILQEPQTGRGLMLYAQRRGEIHWRNPEGPVYGRLHPGAFVSVVPTDRLLVRIGNLPFGHEQEPFVVYVDRDLLGTEPREPAPLAAPADTRTIRWSVWTFGWIADPNEPNMQPAWSSLPCQEVWVSRDLKRVSQYVRGVEAIGIVDIMPAVWPTIQAGGGISCPGHFIAQRGAQLLLTVTDKPDKPDRPDKPVQPTAVARIPDGYEAFELPSSDSLDNAIEKGASLYWLVDDGSGPKCDEWSFKLTRPRHMSAAALPSPANAGGHAGREGRLVRRAKLDKEVAWFPMTYKPSDGSQTAVLHLGTIMLSGGGTLKCDCESDYALLRANDGELVVIDESLPDGLVAYDPSETERWFLTPEKCEAARTEAAQTLERDGSMATRLGFHAVIPAFRI